MTVWLVGFTLISLDTNARAGSLSGLLESPLFRRLELAPIGPALATSVASTYPVASASSSVTYVYINGTGDGNTAPDWQVVDAHHVRLRAERAENGPGRIYTITATCTDRSGNTAQKNAAVSVPKSQGNSR